MRACYMCSINPPRAGQRFCQTCHNEYMRKWRDARRTSDKPKRRSIHGGFCSKCRAVPSAAYSKYCTSCANALGLAWRKAHPLTGEAKTKYDARKAVHSARRRGQIKRGPCLFCGTTERIEAHHEDYSKPLAIVWVCKTHHHAITKGRLSVPADCLAA